MKRRTGLLCTGKKDVSSGSVEDGSGGSDGQDSNVNVKSVVLAAKCYAIKVMQDHDPDMVNELAIGSKLNELSKRM